MGSLSSDKAALTDDLRQSAAVQDEDEDSAFLRNAGGKLTLFPLVALIFYEVSGGPFGIEVAVKEAGPLLSIVGFLVFPILWSVPEALLSAELSTAMPENSGYVVWTTLAFGEFWGFQEGWWKWLSGVIDNSLYAILFLDYLMNAVPLFRAGVIRWVAACILCGLMTYLNYRGLTIVGRTAMGLLVFSLCPFAVMAIMAVPKIAPRRWLHIPKKIGWAGYLNSLMWNLNYFDSASTLAGEVEKPKKIFPKALFLAVILVVVTYVVPLMAGTGSIPYRRESWSDGSFATIAGIVGGQWLKIWIIVAAALSNIGLFEAEMSSDSFQLLGMAERGMLPKAFARRSQHNTPTLAIGCSATGIVLLSWLNFEEIVELLNFLYCISMLVEFATFVQLRIKHPHLDRPFRVPLNTVGVILMLVIPTIIVLVLMSLASWMTMVVSGVGCLLGVVLCLFIKQAKKRGYCEFAVNPELPDLEEEASPHLLPVDSPTPQNGGVISSDKSSVKAEGGVPHSGNESAETENPETENPEGDTTPFLSSR
ncbi:hypothetical protein CBR_g30253 [Chara braunii]|uniref:Amino acid permease/ SLC12A domain-containing protein n=1 Tax=Chara braunii TaxID=69332 RepID=A0A388LCT1_CHABU|nr:hypothetical protein CBR_g30253 [Chara braunii]|eukprot:GBG79992.1 hypothetical protein CBR_g30253 [Chara braunii]